MLIVNDLNKNEDLFEAITLNKHLFFHLAKFHPILGSLKVF
jgi:hypothetical protein